MVVKETDWFTEPSPARDTSHEKFNTGLWKLHLNGTTNDTNTEQKNWFSGLVQKVLSIAMVPTVVKSTYTGLRTSAQNQQTHSPTVHCEVQSVCELIVADVHTLAMCLLMGREMGEDPVIRHTLGRPLHTFSSWNVLLLCLRQEQYLE